MSPWTVLASPLKMCRGQDARDTAGGLPRRAARAPLRFVGLFVGVCLVWPGAPAAAPAQEAPPAGGDRALFDFRAPDAADGWAPYDLAAALLEQWQAATQAATQPEKLRKPVSPEEPPPALQRLGADAAATAALKITYAGGHWPAVGTARLPDVAWADYASLKADVVSDAPGVVVFRLMLERSQPGNDYGQAVTQWNASAFLQAGRNELVLPLALPSSAGKPVAFQVLCYEPAKGQALTLANLRLSRDKAPAPGSAGAAKFGLLGTDQTVGSVKELHDQLKGQWAAPAATTVEAVEAAFRQKAQQARQDHPRAVCAIFRDGQTGWDPANPQAPYQGWNDAYVNGHGPDGNLLSRAARLGGSPYSELFMRHRSRLMRVDLASIPKGSTILAAQLLLVRSAPAEFVADKSTCWVAEACNRPWVEGQVNAYEYAKGKFWKSVSGMYAASYAGDDPDFLPLYLAWGPSQGRVNVWDFTRAVAYWTDGKSANHGFFFHNDGADYWPGPCPTRETKNPADRPAMMVLYEPPAP